MIHALCCRWRWLASAILLAGLALTAAGANAPSAAIPTAPDAASPTAPAAAPAAVASTKPRIPGQLTARRDYPALLPAWQRGPLLDADPMFSPTVPAVAEEAVVRLQATPLHARDPLLRGNTAMNLATCNQAAARDLLLAALPTEKDPAVLADILRALAQLETTTAAHEIAPLLAHASASVRLRAAQLYPTQVDAQADVLLACARVEADQAVQPALWAALAAWPAPEAVTPATWKEMMQLPAAKADARLQWVVVGALAAHPQAGDAGTEMANYWVKAEAAGMRQALATNLGAAVPPALALTLLTALGQDAHAAVRSAAVRTAGRLARPELAAVILARTHDHELAVRQDAAEQLAAFPTAEAYTALVELMGDPASERLRRAAGTSLVTLAAHYPVAAQLPDVFTSPLPAARLEAYHVAAQLPRQQALGMALLPRLTAESDVPLLVAAMQATIAQHHLSASEALLAPHAHASAMVRIQVARAIGELHLVDGAKTLVAYAETDESTAVRSAALTAMGQLPETDFSPTLLAVLQATTTTPDNKIDPNARAAACWAAARAQHLSLPVCSRLLAQISTPVIPTVMTPLFEGHAVRVSAAMALVSQARNGASKEVAALARQALAVLGRFEAAGSNVPVAPMSPILREYAYQMTCYLERTNPVPHEVPPPASNFDYQALATAPAP